MNAKKAKSLRKLLRNLVTHHEKQGNETIPVHDFVVVDKTTKDIYVDKTHPDGSATVEKVRVFDGQKRVAPKSQRGVYLHLKKEMKKV